MEKGILTSKCLLNCELCFRPYDLGTHVPMIMRECGHTYCASCIANRRMDNSGVFTCPKDNASTKLPVAKLFKNAEVIRSLERAKLSSSDICELHNDKLNFFCKTEKKLLCEKCLYNGSHVDHEILTEKLFLETLEKLLHDPKVISSNDKERNENKIMSYLRESREATKRNIQKEFELLMNDLIKQRDKVHEEAESLYTRLEDNLKHMFKDLTKNLLSSSEIQTEIDIWKRDKSNKVAK